MVFAGCTDKTSVKRPSEEKYYGKTLNHFSMDETLIKRQLKKGEEQAFKYLYDCHYALLCRFAYQILRDKLLSEETVSDTIFHLWEHREDIDITCSIRAYLMKAVRNRCLNIIKSPYFQREIHSSALLVSENIDFLDTVFIEMKHPLGYLLEQELEDKLMQLINKLPKECRTVFKKSRFEEKTYDQISQELNISVNTVKYHMKNALAFLQSNLHDYLKLLVFPIFLGN